MQALAEREMVGTGAAACLSLLQRSGQHCSLEAESGSAGEKRILIKEAKKADVMAGNPTAIMARKLYFGKFYQEPNTLSGLPWWFQW